MSSTSPIPFILPKFLLPWHCCCLQLVAWQKNLTNYGSPCCHHDSTSLSFYLTGSERGQKELWVWSELRNRNPGSNCMLKSYVVTDSWAGIKPLLSYQRRQRELVRVLMYLVYLLIHNHPGLCTPFLRSHVTKCDVTCGVTKCDPVTHFLCHTLWHTFPRYK